VCVCVCDGKEIGQTTKEQRGRKRGVQILRKSPILLPEHPKSDMGGSQPQLFRSKLKSADPLSFFCFFPSSFRLDLT
jgi:hypothetical protein